MSIETNRHYNLQIMDPYVTGKWDMPRIAPTNVVPNALLGFNYARAKRTGQQFIHFFLDDYQFERCWNSPERYVELLKRFGGALSPDFSLYLDMPKAMMIWNTYRSRLLGQYWQDNGIPVVPTVSWADEDSFDFCFDGLPKRSTVAISSIGVQKSAESIKIWKTGMTEMVNRLLPTSIVWYGPEVALEIAENIDIIRFENEETERLHRLNKEA